MKEKSLGSGDTLTQGCEYPFQIQENPSSAQVIVPVLLHIAASWRQESS